MNKKSKSKRRFILEKYELKLVTDIFKEREFDESTQSSVGRAWKTEERTRKQGLADARKILIHGKGKIE